MQKVFLISVITLFLYSCNNESPKTEETNEDKLGFDLANIDSTVHPNQNFYQFAVGNWVKNNPVPASEAAWGAFNIVRDRNNEILKKIFEDAAANKNAKKGSNTQKIGSFYRTAMDTNKLNAEGIAPLKPYFEEIDALTKNEEIIPLSAKLIRSGIESLVDFGYHVDFKDNSRKLPIVGFAQTGLPNKDYYLKEDEAFKKYREEYLKFVDNSFKLAGLSDKEPSKTIFSIEKKLVTPQLSSVERRNLELMYNIYSQEDLRKTYPNIDWDAMFNTYNLGELEEINVLQPKYIAEVNKLLKEIPIDDWKTYLRWRVIRAGSSYLSSDFEKENFNFYSGVLRGTKEQKPRWERMIETGNRNLSEIVGQEFVKVAFSEESKERIQTIVKNIQAVFKERLMNLSWMSDSTKQLALEKLESFKFKIGYPDKWQDYSKLEITDKSFFDNILAVNRFNFDKQIAERNDPIDKAEWATYPQIVNAFYHPINNDITFPAGILQPPFFMPDADDAINYGSIGAVIGHEFLHGFDDQGSKFDKNGNMQNWWTEQDRTKFDANTQRLVNQFNEFSPLEGVFVNGQLTLGENIADFGGLTMSYHAMKKAYKGKEDDLINGFNPAQRFFLGWAQVWAVNMTDDMLRTLVNTDPHSPGQYRVNGPLSNMPEFYETWGVKENDGMYRHDSVRVVIW